jgi:hypothetical protein
MSFGRKLTNASVNVIEQVDKCDRTLHAEN